MVSCKHCSTQNSLDSTFCKRCGTSLSEDALQEAQTKLDALIEEGNALFNQGRTEDAMAVADACVASNPSSVSALSLKALCHERKHEIAEALECADRIVELNPDSELDKIKRNALRTRLQADLRVPEPPDRRLAFLGAAASVVLVGCLGVIIARATSRPAADTAVAQRETSGTAQLVANPAPTNVAPPASTDTPTPTANPAAPVADGLNHRPGPDDVPAVGRTPETRSRVNMPDISLPRTGGSTLPPVEGGDRPIVIDPNDVQVQPSEQKTSEPKPSVAKPTNSTKTAGDDEDPGVLNPGGTASGTAQPPAEDPNRGIQIEVSRGSRINRPNRTSSGSEPVSGNGLETLLRVGSEQYQLGNYTAAARSYEQAVRSGGDPIILNQRLGQAYSRLGRNSEAIDAFRRCVEACDSAIAGGRGNRARHESVKATAEQALKVLQGG